MTETAAPLPGTPEYDAAMIARAEAEGVTHTSTDSRTNSTATDSIERKTPGVDETAEIAADPNRPAWLPEKFKTPEDMAASYAELEKKLGAPKPAIADPTKPADAPETPAENAESKPEGQAPALAAVLAKASEEYSANGQFTDESYAALEANGITREYADAYVDGLRARAETITVKLHDAAGGAEQFAKLNAWAGENLSAEQIAAHNRAVTSGDLNVTLGALKSLRSLHDAAEGRAGTVIEGNGGQTRAAGYASKADWMADVASAKYSNDPAFRATVARKVEASLRAGVNLD